MKTSVIFTTCNSPDWLEKVLWGFSCQTRLPDEIVIADDGSSPETRQRIARMRDDTGLNIKHVWQADARSAQRIRSGMLAAALALLVIAPWEAAPAREAQPWRGWPLGERWSLSIGAFFAQLDTSVSAASASDPLGATIKFERDLGLDDSIARPVLSVGWRFAKRHKLRLKYFDLDRSGNTISNVNIRFGDADIEVGLPVESFFDVKVLEGFYTYSLVFTEKVDLSLGLGLSLQDMDFGIRAEDGQIIESESVSLTAPLPTLHAIFSYAFSERWMARVDVGWLAVEADVSDSSDFAGDIWNSSAGLRFKAWGNLAVDMSWAYFDIDVDYNKRDLRGKIDYDYHGPLVALQIAF